MKKRIGALGLAILLAGSILPTGLVSAADVPYGMEYSGGADLGASNVQIQPGLVDSLVPIVNAKTFDVSDSTFEWAEGYRELDQPVEGKRCMKQSYFLIKKSDVPSLNKKIVVKAIGDKYTRETQITDVRFYDPNHVMGENDTLAVWTTGSFSFLNIFPTEADCENGTNMINTWDFSYSRDQGLSVYAEATTRLYDNETGELPQLDDVYFVIGDIDASQSYKILNEGNELEKANMIARSANDFLPDTADVESRNKYVSSGKYIYSEGHFNIAEKKSNIYMPLKTSAWEDGVHVIYGFRNLAGSFTEYYSKQYKVEYKSDGNGVVTGIKKEDVLSGENPTGSETKPNENYKFTHWVADKDVELEDGTEIKAGTPMTPEQVKKVVVHENLVFTAYHEPVPKTPDTGNFTGGTNAIGITTSIMAVVTVAFLAWFAPKLTHKKVKFDKH